MNLSFHGGSPEQAPEHPGGLPLPSAHTGYLHALLFGPLISTLFRTGEKQIFLNICFLNSRPFLADLVVQGMQIRRSRTAVQK